MVSDELKWGWVRLALGIAQMSLVVAAVISFFYVGLDTITLLLVIAATATTLVSRHVYEGRPVPPTRTSTTNDKDRGPTPGS